MTTLLVRFRPSTPDPGIWSVRRGEVLPDRFGPRDQVPDSHCWQASHLIVILGICSTMTAQSHEVAVRSNAVVGSTVQHLA